MTGRPNPWRLLLIAAAGAILPAGSCEDNLGDVSSGPVVFRASVGTGNQQADGSSTFPSSSADGRYVAFASTARNLALPSSNFKEVFVRDRWNDTVVNATKFSRLPNPAELADCEEPVMSPNGRYLAFLTRGMPTFVVPFPPNPQGVQPTLNAFVVDLQGDPSVPVVYTPLLGTADWPENDIENISIADDGRVAFQTFSSNVPINGGGYFTVTSNCVFVCQPFLGNPPVITMISHALGAPETQTNGSSVEPRISADGLSVAFASRGTNMTADAYPAGVRQQIFWAATDGSSVELVSRATGAAGAPSDEHCLRPAISADGRYVSFLQQDNLAPGPGPLLPGEGGQLVVRRDRLSAPPSTDLMGFDPFIFILFSPIGGTTRSYISDDGRHVAFLRLNATQTDLEVVVGSVGGGEIVPSFTLVPPSGTLLVFPEVALSGDGRWVFWSSEAENQVLEDTNNSSDIFGYGPIR